MEACRPQRMVELDVAFEMRYLAKMNGFACIAIAQSCRTSRLLAPQTTLELRPPHVVSQAPTEGAGERRKNSAYNRKSLITTKRIAENERKRRR